LNAKHRATTGKKSRDLSALNPANFHLIGADGKNRRARGLAKFPSIVSFADQET